MRRRAVALLALAALPSAGCVLEKIFQRNVVALVSTPQPVLHRLRDPVRKDARLAALWVGHATVLLQLDDKFILTDPVFTDTVGGGFSRRLVEPGIAVNDLPPIDLAVVSHLHFDHLSLSSLDLLEPRLGQLLLPRGGLVYVPDYRFAIDEVARWQTFSLGDLKITAVPVKHPGFRYGADAAWMTASATGWVFEYHGLTVYFGGDTAYDKEAFRATGARFPGLDLAILPIGPVEPPEFTRPNHIDGREALQAFFDLGAAHMLPVHYDTFAHGVDPPGYAAEVLRRAVRATAVEERQIHLIPIGAQLTLHPTGAIQASPPVTSVPPGRRAPMLEGAPRRNSDTEK